MKKYKLKQHISKQNDLKQKNKIAQHLIEQKKQKKSQKPHNNVI